METSLGKACGQGEQEASQVSCVRPRAGARGVYCPWHTSPSEFGGMGHTLVLASLRGAYFHHLAELLAAGGLGLDQLEP